MDPGFRVEPRRGGQSRGDDAGGAGLVRGDAAVSGRSGRGL